MPLDYLAGVYGGYDSAQVIAVEPATGARLKDYPAWDGVELERILAWATGD